MKTIKISALIVAFVISVSANAQMKAEKLSNPKWYRMAMIKFKTDQADAAKAFINKNFVPVDKEFGRTPIGFETPFGQWDVIVFFPLENIAELDWKISPSDERWLAILTKQQGGAENVQKLFKQWSSFIEKSEAMLVRQAD